MKNTRVFDALFAAPVALHEEVHDSLHRAFGMPGKAGLDADSSAFLQTILSAAMGRGVVKPSRTYSSENGVAIIGVYGVIVPNEDSGNDYWGLISCERIRSDIATALADENVSQILLAVSSPGGSVIGLDQTAAAIRDAAKIKPVAAFSYGMTASAAYYLASQASEFVVSKDSINGSIGVFATLMDLSAYYMTAGVKVEVVRFGAMKGAGAPGTPITDAQRAERQTIVNTYGDQFVDAVAAGRKMPREKALALANGAVYVGEATVKAGLADSVDTYDSLYSRLVARAKVSPARASGLPKNKGAKAMTPEEEKKAKEDAIKAERERTAAITAEFPNHAPFANRMITEGKTLLEAQAEFSKELQKEMKAKDEAHTKALEDAKKGQPGAKIGNTTIPTGSNPGGSEKTEGADEGGTAKEKFTAKVDELIGKGVDRAVAVQRAAAKYPDLHKAMVLAANPGAGADLDKHESFAR